MLDTGLYVVVLLQRGKTNLGASFLRVQSVYGPWTGNHHATKWALRNLAQSAEWTVEPVLSGAEAAPLRTS